MDEKKHDATALPLEDRVAYMTVVASMAGVDVELDSSEVKNLRALCEKLELPDAETSDVIATAARPTDTIERKLDRLKKSDLRFTLLTDCLFLAYADGSYGDEERAEIVTLAKELDIDAKQVAAMDEYVQTVRQAAKSSDGDMEEKGKELAAKLAAVGVPFGAIGMATAVGMATVGAEAGLAALALGLGVASGFGALITAGVGTYMGVRWLKNRLAKSD